MKSNNSRQLDKSAKLGFKSASRKKNKLKSAVGDSSSFSNLHIDLMSDRNSKNFVVNENLDEVISERSDIELELESANQN